jgi:hypothetical protein
MSREEWLFARMLSADVRDAPPKEAFAYWRAAGWDEERIAAEAKNGWGRFSSLVSPVPVSFIRMRDGDSIRIGSRNWRVLIGSGHSPEHACLVDEAGGVMIAGDQVLPRITSNVSLSVSEPEGDPLGDWLGLDRQAEDARRRPARPAFARRAVHGVFTLDSMHWTRGTGCSSTRSTPIWRSRAVRWTASQCCSAARSTKACSDWRPGRRWRISGGWKWRAGQCATCAMG